jgi:RNA polymerase sigma factor (sigma-70 family)
MDDAQLVAAARAGDRSAWAAIYDRYADRIHDFCASMLRNRADASDTMQETFLIGFENLDQLAQPERLGPWLYAIAHRSILDRTGPEGLALGIDAAGEVLWGSDATQERPSRAELAEFVWQAAAGLDERERALLDLHLRQRLEGPDLASAAGVAAGPVDSRVERLEAQIERSLGALLVARTGRRNCPELYAVLAGWDGRLTPEFRERVTAHVDDCEMCNSRRRIAPSPLALVAAAPMSPAPAYLRSVVLGKAELDAVEHEDDARPGAGRLPASAGWVFNRDGFPDLTGDERPRVPRSTGPVFASTRPTTVMAAGAGAAGAGAAGAGAVGVGAAGVRATAPTTYLPIVGPPPPRSPDDRRGILVGGLAGLIILFAAIVIVVSSRSKGPSSGSIAVGVTTSIATATSQPTTTTPATTAPTTSIAPTTIATIGHLIVASSKPIELGTGATSASLIVGNNGAAPLDYAATASGAGLSVNPSAGTLGPSGSQTLTIALDRSASAAGPFIGTIVISSPGGTANVTVNAVIDPGPSIIGENYAPPLVYTSGCHAQTSTTTPTASTTAPTPTTSMVTATVTTTLPLQVVVLHWQSAADGSGTRTMTTTGILYGATLGPFTMKDSVDWWITAIDSAGAIGTSSHHTLGVICP